MTLPTAASGDRHARALGEEQPGGGEPDAAGAASDDRDLF
jgi:hypothetical protein